eukprot:5610514-Amphidinium_carterae.1
MDNYKHLASTDYLLPRFPISQFTVPERIRQAGHWLDLPYDQVNTALDFAQKTINDDFVFMLETGEEAQVDHNWQAENACREIDQYSATVHLSSKRNARLFRDAIANAQPLTEEELETAVTDRLLNILTPTSAAATPVPTASV